MKAGYKLALLAGAVTVWAACSEQLAAPTPCAKPCLAGPEIRQDTIAPLNGADSSFAGYILADHQTTLLVSNNLPAGDDRAFVRFIPRADFVTVGTDTIDSLSYTIDSVALQFNLVARDSMVKGDSLIIFRLDPGADTTITFAQLEAAATDPTRRIGSVALLDSVHTGSLRLVLDSAQADSLLFIPPADSGKLSVGLMVGADTPTGFVLSAAFTSNAPGFVTYVKADTADTTLQKQVLLRTAQQSGFRVRNPVAPPADHLTLGGMPSSRGILRFALPKFITDTATVVKAQLYLVPTQPVYGLPNVNARVEVRNALTDLGRKSPVSSTVIEADSLVFGTADTVFLPVTTLVRAWGGSIDLPHILVVSLREEGGSFAQPIFGSTRTPGYEPRLVVTYTLPYKFSSP
ncbi:MAG TPA: hypothetical protein VJN95_17560 [Gemmatimonadales bacterium]|nr:hypothetical protein [Gemmatimonadales bacterium]